LFFSEEEQNKSQDVISKKSFVRQLDMHVDNAVENRKASLEAFDEFKGMWNYRAILASCEKHEITINITALLFQPILQNQMMIFCVELKLLRTQFARLGICTLSIQASPNNFVIN
jgi:hypothetical protein